MSEKNKLEKYVIDGVGEPFDGLVATIKKWERADSVGEVLHLEKQGDLFGGFSIPIKGLWIDYDCLKPISEEEEHDPGLYCGSTTYDFEPITVSCTLYENMMAVNVKDDSKTLFSKNYFGESIDRVHELLSKYVNVNNDWSDIQFHLKAIK